MTQDSSRLRLGVLGIAAKEGVTGIAPSTVNRVDGRD